MKNTQKITIVKFLSILVLLTGAVVMVGWIFDIGVLKSILPQWVTMKFTTALCFFMSGLLLYMIVRDVKNLKSDEFISPTMALPIIVIFFLMGSLLASSFFDVNTGVENLFVKEKAGAIASVKPGRPSLGTMVCFLSTGIAGLFMLFRIKQIDFVLKISGIIVAFGGSLALIGYLTNTPVLYYTVENVSTAMAVHTAILFVIIGIGLFIASFACIEIPLNIPENDVEPTEE